jgi:PilZ domain
VKVNLLGRYMLADRREFPCQVVDMSPGGMALQAPMAGQPGERVIAYVDHLGRLEGKVARTFENGFEMTISATLRKRDKLGAQLTWLANRQILNLPEDAATAGLRHATQWRASCCPMAPMSPAA